MIIIEHQMPSINPLEGWPFPTAPGKFHFAFESVLRLFRAKVARNAPFAHMWSRRRGIYKDYVKAVGTLKWLEETWLQDYGNNEQSIVVWPDSLPDLWSHSSDLIFL